MKTKTKYYTDKSLMYTFGGAMLLLMLCSLPVWGIIVFGMVFGWILSWEEKK